MKVPLIVDVQNHFLTYNKNEINNYLNKIINFLDNNKTKKLIFVFDQMFKESKEQYIEENYDYEEILNILQENEDYNDDIENLDEEEILEYNINKIDNYINDNYQLFDNDLPLKLIKYFSDNNIQYTIIKKTYGDLRELIDTDKMEKIALLSYITTNPLLEKNYYNGKLKKINKFLIKNNINSIEEMEITNDELNNIKNILSNSKSEYGNFVNNKYQIIGGGATECLLEELLKIKVIYPKLKIDYDINLMYGETYDFKRKYKNFIEVFQGLLNNEKNLNKQDNIITI